jgi:hypothetical protein
MEQSNMSRSKSLIIGPWVGEFGWELFCWQNFGRAIAENYAEVRVICRKGNKALYEDYADLIEFFEPQPGYSDMWMHSAHTKQNPWRIDYDYGDTTGCDIMRPQLLDYNGLPLDVRMDLEDVPDMRFWRDVEPQHESLENLNVPLISRGIDVVLHARNRSVRSGDNWDLKNWDELTEALGSKGITIAFIGSLSESYCPKGAIDFRGAPLNTTISLLKGAKLLASPSSGPVHLAALCNLPHIVWTVPANRRRNTNLWNPFKTKVIFIDEFEWDPPVHEIENSITDLLESIECKA